ncbi:hypothetical protein TRFO_30978 [Tritrichomonas foetus]|uniref:Uncharacterized protein n=1 Tax=Tritrichomonas foetus TaxID=1144522 RepID=A0A1J4JSI9_9EUKA|nr:hypothetical protein TRFO_30978 [Tritrichomonas foetus]|eukprot:OHT02019.1 hypothetical protein TRFO_30978 [Tritrichomonas foetus]
MTQFDVIFYKSDHLREKVNCQTNFQKIMSDSTPLDSVPTTGLRKRKLKRNYVEPPAEQPSEPKPEETQPTPTPDPTPQPAAVEAPQVLDSVQSAGPLRKRKAKTSSSTISPSDFSPDSLTSSSPTPTASTQPSQFSSSPTNSTTPVETNEIPDIDLMGESSHTRSTSNENLYSTSSHGSRLGLDTEQEHTLASRYMNPNFDLSRIGKHESKQLLNKSVSKEYGERFTKDMSQREEIFRKEYVKPIEKSNDIQLSSIFLMKELESVLASTALEISNNAEKFDLSKCHFEDLPLGKTEFHPNLSGLARTYTMTSQEAIDSLSGKQKVLSVNDLKTELDAAFVPTPPDIEIRENDFIAEVDKLFDASNKQISPTEFLIDLSTVESIKLIEKITSFFAIGLKGKASGFFDRLYSQMNEDSRNRANIVPLQTALIQAKTGVSDNSNFKYMVSVVLNLIQQAQCSALLRYMSGLLTFKLDNYFGDAFILDSYQCNQLSEIVEKIECVQLIGAFPKGSIPNSPSVPGDRYALRISSSVENYLKQTRNWLLQGVEVNQEHINPLTDILKLFTKSFLAQKNGSILGIDALLEIFESISTLTIDHPAHKKFVSIVQNKEIVKLWDNRSKVWTIVTNCLNSKILPYVILFGISIPQTKTTMNPAYFRDPIVCLKIAYALLPMKYPNFNVGYESIKHKVASLE